MIELTSDESGFVFDIEQLVELEVLVVVGSAVLGSHVVLLLW